MAQNKKVRFGPSYIANSATNILNPNVTSLAGPVGLTLTQPYFLVGHIRIVNTDSSARTFSLYVGATGGSTGGTQVMGGTQSVAANSYVEEYFNPPLRLDSADFLTGIASQASTLVFTAEGEVGF